MSHLPTGRQLLRRLAAGAVGLTLVAAASACGGDSGSGSADDEVVIGAYSSATGALQLYGLDEERGWQLAQDDINREGGIAGRKLTIRYKDDASDPTQARSIMAEFASDSDVIGVMGPTSTANALASHPLAVKAHLPVISVSNSGNKIVSQGPEVYRVFVPDPVLLRPVVDRAVDDFSLTHVAILYAQDDPFSLDSLTAFKSALADNGVTVSASVAYSKGNPDLSPQIRQIMEVKPQAVFVAAYATDAGSFLKQARALGLDVPVIGNQSFNSPSQLKVAGGNAGTLLVGSQWFLGDPEPRNQQFVKAYRARFHADPGEFAAMAYNGAYVIKAALEASHDFSRAGLSKGLASLTTFTLLGSPVEFTNRDASTDKPLILTVANGEFALYRGRSS